METKFGYTLHIDFVTERNEDIFVRIHFADKESARLAYMTFESFDIGSVHPIHSIECTLLADNNILQSRKLEDKNEEEDEEEEDEDEEESEE